jgi:hypothetical protein
MEGLGGGGGLAIHPSVGCPGPWWTEEFIGGGTSIGASLSGVRMIMTIMHILVEELLCETLMVWILLFQCLLLGVRARLWLRPIVPDNKWHCLRRTRL